MTFTWCVFRSALGQPGRAKVIYLRGRSLPYQVNLAQHGETERLSFNGMTLDNHRPSLQLVNYVMVSGLLQLDIYNVNLYGSLRTNCSLGSFFLNLVDVHVTASRNGFVIKACDRLTVNVTRSTFVSALLQFTSYLTTDASFVDSNFVGAASNDTEPRKGGVLIVMPRRQGKHMIKITGCSFVGLRQYFDTSLPSAAVGVVTMKEDTELQVSVERSTFTDNGRAIDLSLKGITDVEITENVFRGNKADGSGGAIRFSPTLQKGFGSLSVVRRATIKIVNCTFEHNLALTSSRYDENDVYYQTRSSGSGGALFVHLAVPSPLPRDGLVSVRHCRFANNTAPVRGGTIYVNADISTKLAETHFVNAVTVGVHSRFGDLVYASCNMTMENVTVEAATSDSGTPLFSYQASDPANARLLVLNLQFSCPMAHWVEQLNATSYGNSGGIETLQIFCRACSENKYSLATSRVKVDWITATVENDISCLTCPYGAKCVRGIWNNIGFWGREGAISSAVTMFPCPPDYCEQNTSRQVAYDACAADRVGVLCGRCRDGYSESLFGTNCIPNSLCGWQNWFVAVFIALYGILYVLFFMFENDYSRLIQFISDKLLRRTTAAAAAAAERNTDADLSETGYFQIFMYYIQTSSLLQVTFAGFYLRYF